MPQLLPLQRDVTEAVQSGLGITVFLCFLRPGLDHHLNASILFPLSTLHPHLCTKWSCFPAELCRFSVNCKDTWRRLLREGKPDWLCELNVFLCNFEWPFNPEMDGFALLIVIIWY